MAKKDLALLTLQSLVYLPVLIFVTKGTVVVLLIAVICGIFYVRSRLSFKPFNVWTLLLVTGAVSAIWSITPEQSLERAVKLALFLLLLGGLVHVVNRWSEADRQYLADLGHRAWLVSLLIVLPIVIFEGELKTSLVSALPGQEDERLRVLLETGFQRRGDYPGGHCLPAAGSRDIDGTRKEICLPLFGRSLCSGFCLG